jgi:hypothetical protein
VQETSSKSREHRLRVLEHQARLEAGRAQGPSDAQRKIPLLVEVKPASVEKLPRPARGRAKGRVKQARFEGL